MRIPPFLFAVFAVAPALQHYDTAISTYAFGDGDLAVERMATVAEVFAASSARFLAGAVRAPAGLAVDLGCGPGHSTRLLATTVRPARTVGLEASVSNVKVAAAGRGHGSHDGALEFLRWRVTDPVGDHRLVDGGEVLQVAGGGASRARWTCERRG